MTSKNKTIHRRTEVNPIESKHLKDNYYQKESDIDGLFQLLDDEKLTNEDVLKNLFVFVVSSNAYKPHSHIWVNEQIKIERTFVQEKQTKRSIFKNGVNYPKPYYSMKLVGWDINSKVRSSIWSDRPFSQNMLEIILKLDKSSIPFRTDKNEAIRESNDINFLIGELAKTLKKTINLQLSVWSIYDVLKYADLSDDDDTTL